MGPNANWACPAIGNVVYEAGYTCPATSRSPLYRRPHRVFLRLALGTQRAAAGGTQLPKTGARQGPQRSPEEVWEGAGHSPAVDPLGRQSAGRSVGL